MEGGGEEGGYLLLCFFSIIYILGLVCYKHTIHVYYKIIIMQALSIVYIAYFLTFQCNGKEICWSHLEGLYCRESGANRDAPGLAMVPKLKYEHIHLSSFSKMRVDLAAQVCKILHPWSAFFKLYNNNYVVIIGFK